MANAIWDTLPLGLGIALNPIAIVVSILILRTANARQNGVAFVIGWIVGLALLVAVSARVIHDQIGTSRESGTERLALIWIGLGALLLVASIRALRHRPLPGESPATDTQRWLRLVNRSGFFQVLGAGLFLAMVSLRNLTLLAAAAGMIGGAHLAPLEVIVAVIVFVAISSLGLLIPLFVRLFGGAVADTTLASWAGWLNQHMATITAAVMGLLGTYLVVRGLVGLLA